MATPNLPADRGQGVTFDWDHNPEQHGPLLHVAPRSASRDKSEGDRSLSAQSFAPSVAPSVAPKSVAPSMVEGEDGYHEELVEEHLAMAFLRICLIAAAGIRPWRSSPFPDAEIECSWKNIIGWLAA